MLVVAHAGNVGSGLRVVRSAQYSEHTVRQDGPIDDIENATHTKDQYTTAWPIDNLIVSGSADNNKPHSIGPLTHPVTPSGCVIFYLRALPPYNLPSLLVEDITLCQERVEPRPCDGVIRYDAIRIPSRIPMPILNIAITSTPARVSSRASVSGCFTFILLFLVYPSYERSILLWQYNLVACGC